MGRIGLRHDPAQKKIRLTAGENEAGPILTSEERQSAFGIERKRLDKAELSGLMAAAKARLQIDNGKAQEKDKRDDRDEGRRVIDPGMQRHLGGSK
ncbi:hypothetical protein AA105894_2638 [Asaia spathodeae NBRC 105894]|nr:hypothetical protein AA105894_2638 [Asaia spathodeae NBRC 105894]